MPQCAGGGWRASDLPYGKGSLYSELLEATFRRRRRAKKINDSENGRLVVFRDMIDRHQHSERERKDKVIAKVRKSIEEMEAYKKVLDSYRADKFVTMKRGFKKRQINTPNSFRRYQLETKVYTCGFSVDTLYPEVEQTIYDSQPHRKKEERFKKLLTVAKTRSDFMIDRRITNEAMKREKMSLNKIKEATSVDFFENETSSVTQQNNREKSMLKSNPRTFSNAPTKIGRAYFQKPLPPIKRAASTSIPTAKVAE